MVWTRTGSKLPQGMTPSIIRGNRSAGGSFSILPLVLYDQTLSIVGTGPNDGGFRFVGGDSTLKQNGGGSIISVDSLPLQWHTARPGSIPSSYGVRYTALFDSNVTAFVFDFPAVDVWRTPGTQAFDMVRPGAGVLEGFTLTIQIALNSDLSTILAQADIRYEWDRT